MDLQSLYSRNHWQPASEPLSHASSEGLIDIFEFSKSSYANNADYLNLSEANKIKFRKMLSAEMISDLVHSEKMVLRMSSGLVSGLSSLSEQCLAAVQSADEAKHVFILMQYLQLNQLPLTPIAPVTKAFFEKVLKLDFEAQVLCSQIVGENLGFICFQNLKQVSIHSELRQIAGLLLADEAHHLNLANRFLKDIRIEKSPSKICHFEEILIEQVQVIKSGLLSVRVPRQFGFDEDVCIAERNFEPSSIRFKIQLLNRIEKDLARIEFLTPRLQHFLTQEKDRPCVR